MERDHHYFNNLVNGSSERNISLSQLRRILLEFDYKAFNDITQQFFQKEIEKKDKHWTAIDGKELRGSIDKVSGEKRGENIVVSSSHSSKDSEVIDFYSGKKESERNVVSSYVEKHPKPSGLKGKAFSLDALHNSSSLLKSIHERDGTYLTQIKGNQKYLLIDLDKIEKEKKAEGREVSELNAHGRLEKREASFYSVSSEDLDERWGKANVSTLIKVTRQVTKNKTGQKSIEDSYYISNLNPSKSERKELFDAVRSHWVVESNNYIRDVSFGEDQFKSFEANLQRSVSTFLTHGLNLLKRYQKRVKQNNLNILREELVYNRELVQELFQ